MLGTFVSGTYIALTCKGEVAVDCALVCICTNVRSIGIYRMTAM